ncbi:MAG: hypothetical protein IJP54_01475 [Synergistaceae bacterium]|nr:hypothetical protein [Synergistaceae bacterium]
MNGLYLANVLNGVLCVTVIIAFAVKDITHFPRNMKDLLALPEYFVAREGVYGAVCERGRGRRSVCGVV